MTETETKTCVHAAQRHYVLALHCPKCFPLRNDLAAKHSTCVHCGVVFCLQCRREHRRATEAMNVKRVTARMGVRVSVKKPFYDVGDAEKDENV